MQTPLLYQPGLENAQALNPELAVSYMAQTHIGDPLADAAIASLVGYEPREVHRLIQAGMDGRETVFRDAPLPLRDFFEQIAEPPPWFNPAAVYPGCRAFHDHSDLFIPAFFVVTLQNAATLISRAFYLTGRVLTGYGPRRIRQNTRHFIEIMLPGALERHGDGWKLSVRIRLVHAQIRHLLLESDDWECRRLRYAAERRPYGSGLCQLFGHDAAAGGTAGRAPGRRGAGKFYANLALCVLSNRHAGVSAV